MARRVLDHTSATAHTGTTRSNLGIPMGAWIIRDRPAVRSVRIRYGNGTIYNLGSRELTTRHRPQSYRLHLDDGALVLDHPSPTEAAVPHHDDPLPPLDPDT